MTGDAVLVVDAGTSGVRAAVVTADATVAASSHRQVLPTSPAPTFVEFDPVELRDAALGVVGETLAAWGGPVVAVGITNQRASTVLWDRATGRPVGPGVGWQDLRTAGMCLMLQEQGLRLAPNASATKLAFLLDLADPDRAQAEAGTLAFGTVDTWLAWCLSEGAIHATDWSNACVTGLVATDASGWSARALETLRVPEAVLPDLVDSAGVLGEATALPGAPPIAGLAGDQQASLLGQGCVTPGTAKATFGTGGMLDMCVGADRPSYEQQGPAGTVPLVAWRLGGSLTWCTEGVMLTAGAAVEWLRDDLGLLASSAESADLAASVPDAGGVVFVPALLGLGTPAWDFGARGTLLGLTRGTGRAEVVRAVLEGVAHRGADLLEAAESDTGLRVDAVRVDGGMAANPVFLQAFADACGRPVEVCPVTEATTLGAGFLAGIAGGVWDDVDETAALFRPARVVEPGASDAARSATRERWLDAVERSRSWVPELSALSF
jgi:glycerol kinase